jgi:hypothetical protein
VKKNSVVENKLRNQDREVGKVGKALLFGAAAATVAYGAKTGKVSEALNESGGDLEWAAPLYIGSWAVWATGAAVMCSKPKDLIKIMKNFKDPAKLDLSIDESRYKRGLAINSAGSFFGALLPAFLIVKNVDLSLWPGLLPIPAADFYSTYRIRSRLYSVIRNREQ